MAEPLALTGDPGQDRQALAALARCVREGGVALIPTDTVYGLACDPASAKAVKRLYGVKERPPDKPSALIFFNLEAALRSLDFLPPLLTEALRRLLPGALTVILPNEGRRWPLACEPAQALAGSPPSGEPPGLGVRVPRLAGRLACLKELSLPLLQSSANRSGGRDAGSLAALEGEVVARADLVIDGGRLGGEASTVVDLRGLERGEGAKVVREGPVSRAEIEAALADLR